MIIKRSIQIFQPTLPRGERLYSHRVKFVAKNFNPRSRVGSDGNAPSDAITSIISTHAPAWGATAGDTLDQDGFADFNPRSRVGSDYHMAGLPEHGQISTHAPAWGATKKGRRQRQRKQHFNPRSRVGSDQSRERGL